MKKLKIVLSIIVMTILIPVLFFSLVILIDSYKNPDEVPSFFGWKPFIVLSGSMETEINSGDIAVVKEVELKEINQNDIIAYKSDDVVITHRVTDIINENGKIKYKTKGDNNNLEDNNYVSSKQVEGKYQFKIGGLGNLAMFVQTPIGMIICLSIPVILLLLIQKLEQRELEKNNISEESKKKHKKKKKDDKEKETKKESKNNKEKTIKKPKEIKEEKNE